MKSKPMEEEMLPDQLNDELYRVLEHLQVRLNEIVQKSEDLLDLSQQVSFQATLKRLNTSARGDNYQKIPKTYFPPPSDQESFERKFKLLRRCGHILGDTMLKIRNSLCELHDATRKQKQDIVKLKKDEYGVKREILKPKPPEIIQQPILLEDDDDIQIIPKVEYIIEQTEMLMTSIACEPVYHISCTCKLEEILEQKIPQELKLCIAVEALQQYDRFYLNSILVQEYKKTNKLPSTKCNKCITYESIFLNDFNFPSVYLNFARTARGETTYFPLFQEISDLFNDQTLFLYGMNQLSKQLVSNDIQKVGNVKYLMNLLHTESLNGLVINVYNQNIQKSQFLVDLITAMIALNGKQIIMGVNKLTFPECNGNPKIVLTRFTHKLSQQEKELLEQNINTRQDGGFRLNQFGSKLKRTVIIFSKEKTYISNMGMNIKHWEFPVDHIKQQCDAYHYAFLIYYIDHVVKCKIQDKLAKFFTILLTLLNQKSNNIKEFPQNLVQEFDFFIKNRNYSSYYCIKTLDKEKKEEYLQESLKPTKIQCLSKDVSRLLGIEED